MTDQPQKVGLEHRLLATGYDRDNFPRMDSERWLPVGLAREAAAEITRLRAQRDQLVAALKECADDLEAELKGRYDRTLDYPSQRMRFERDMVPVMNARAAVAAVEDRHE